MKPALVMHFLWVRSLGLWWLWEFGSPAKVLKGKKVLEKLGRDAKITFILGG